MKKFVLSFLLVALFLPSLALATTFVTEKCLLGIDIIPIPCVDLFAVGPAGAYTFTGLALRIINMALWVVGILSVLFVIIGGFRYVTAAGNEERAEGAKKTITHAIIGIVIVILSFVIIRVISNALIYG